MNNPDAMNSERLRSSDARNRWAAGVSHVGATALLVLAPPAFGLYAVWRGQDISWDLQNYHLFNPYSYLNERLLVDLWPAGLQSYFNPYLDLLYFVSVSWWDPRTVGFLLGAIHGLSFVTLYAISRRLLGDDGAGRATALFLAASGVLSLGFLSEVGTVLHDNLMTLLLLSSLWLVLSCIHTPQGDGGERVDVGKMILAGTLAGAANGLKLSCAIFSLAMCLAILSVRSPWRTRVRSSIMFGAFVLVGLAISDGVWMYRIYSHFGSPVFPFFNDIFQAELVEAVPAMDRRFVPVGAVEALFYPVIFTLNPFRVSEVPYYQLSWLFAFVAFVCLIFVLSMRLFRRRAWRSVVGSRERVFLSYFFIGYLLWLLMFGIYRYVVPIEVLVPLVIFVAWRLLFRGRYAWGACWVVAAMTLFNLSGGVPDWGHAEWADDVYRVEPGRLSDGPEPAVVYLAGRPVAWIGAALDIDSPFIQLLPEVRGSEAYWRRATDLVEGRDGERFVVLATEDPALEANAVSSLENLGLRMNCQVDGYVVGYLGASRFEYRYCQVDQAASQ